MASVVIGTDAKCCAVIVVVIGLTCHFELQLDGATASRAVCTDWGETITWIKNQVDDYVSNEVMNRSIDVYYVHEELEHTL